MAELVFATEMRGSAVPVEGKENTFQANTSGTGPNGETVNFESEVVLTGEGFNEVGTITYVGRGSVRFDTIGVGYITGSPVAGVNYGAVLWNVTGGDGEFSGVTGVITSNFSFAESGEVADSQYARIFTP